MTRVICIKDGKQTVKEMEVITPQPTTDDKIAELKFQLANIDRLTIRPLRAIQAGTATDEDREKLNTLEQEALNIRQQISELESEES